MYCINSGIDLCDVHKIIPPTGWIPWGLDFISVLLIGVYQISKGF
jgi:hypothetical protein